MEAENSSETLSVLHLEKNIITHLSHESKDSSLSGRKAMDRRIYTLINMEMSHPMNEFEKGIETVLA
jgi:hypothetical protein